MKTIPGKILCLFFLVVAPVVTFGVTADYLPEWKGTLGAYATIMLNQQVARYFYPFVALGASAAAWVIFFPRSAKSGFVRMGVYSAVLIAVQYLIIMMNAEAGRAYTIISAVLIPGFFILPFLCRPLFRFLTGKRVIFSASAIYLVGVACFNASDPFRPWWEGFVGVFLGVGIAAFLISPPVAVVVCARVAKWCFDVPKNSNRAWAIFWPVWGGSWLWAWRRAIDKTTEIYASLPDTPPDCYIATVAATGHTRLVGSSPVHFPDGTIFYVNRQIRVLKITELFVSAFAPKIHAPSGRSMIE